jgi:hypothetical protein
VIGEEKKYHSTTINTSAAFKGFWSGKWLIHHQENTVIA